MFGSRENTAVSAFILCLAVCVCDVKMEASLRGRTPRKLVAKSSVGPNGPRGQGIDDDDATRQPFSALHGLRVNPGA